MEGRSVRLRPHRTESEEPRAGSTGAADVARPAAGRGRFWAVGSVIGVALVAIVLRVPALGFGLPYLWHSDEPINVGVIGRMVDGGSWNPHFFAYPSLLFDLGALAGEAQKLTGGWVHGAGLSGQNLGTNHTGDPHLFLILRSMTLVASVALCPAVWVTVRSVTGRVAAATVAGLLLAASPLMVANGVFVTPDTYSALFTALGLYYALRIVRSGRPRDYVGAGLAVGLSAGAKYNAVVVAVAVIAAHLLAGAGIVGRIRWLLWSAGVAVATFVVVTPGALVDVGQFYDQATAQARMYGSGHVGVAGSSFTYYLHVFTGQGIVYPVLAVLAAAGLLGPWRREWLVVAVYTVAYMGLLSVQVVHFARDLLPGMVGMAILVGIGVAGLGPALSALSGLPAAWRPAWTRVAAPVVVAAAVAAGLVGPVRASLGQASALADHPRSQAAAWLAGHVRPGQVVAVEPYGPWLPAGRYQLDETPLLLSLPRSALPGAAAALVLAEDGSGRYLADPVDFPAQVARYRQLRADYCLGADFRDGPWIRILVPCARPPG